MKIAWSYLTFAIATDTKYLDNTQSNQEYCYEYTDIQIAIPVPYGDTRSCKLKGEDGEPAQGVVPTHGKSPKGHTKMVISHSHHSRRRGRLPCWTDEPDAIREESSIFGIDDREFSQRLDC